VNGEQGLWVFNLSWIMDREPCAQQLPQYLCVCVGGGAGVCVCVQ
jgi:hypothetical protein